MSNTNTFDPSTIDPAKKATFKQVRRVAIQFSGDGFKSIGKGKPNWPIVNVAVALILEYQNKVAKKELTHGDIQKMLKGKTLPKKYRDLYDESKRNQKISEEPEVEVEDDDIVDF